MFQAPGPHPPSIIYAAFFGRNFFHFILVWEDEKLLQAVAVDVAKGDGGVTKKTITFLFIACLREI